MFERFTSSAREVVVQAQREARELGHCYVGAEHLVLGVLAQPDAPGVGALYRAGFTPEAWRAALEDAFRTQSGSGHDAAALSTVGIDMDEVRDRVEAAFGPGALDPPAPRRRRRRRWVPGDTRSGHIPFTDRAKRSLERALREALLLKDKHIGVEHILLGVLDPHWNMAIEILRRSQVDPDQLRSAVLADLGKAA